MIKLFFLLFFFSLDSSAAFIRYHLLRLLPEGNSEKSFELHWREGGGMMIGESKLGEMKAPLTGEISEGSRVAHFDIGEKNYGVTFPFIQGAQTTEIPVLLGIRKNGKLVPLTLFRATFRGDPVMKFPPPAADPDR